ncbi:hypothetical protein SAMN05216257_101290 [Meinhardsimonia xiamenensis]|jgi:hypothetical protein|uniref:Aminoglycoside phosphotransferase domain-containing protein n=1 Tax=Meinhardsimonia xiamenensis TaxID=990712 RepID=A0A1G8YE06_9RHOB|nr:hypothetical protein [Meinhardsimonia xiamenensis]PRX37269.1 hypothetical protein LV81_01046 [Meinhardsimonia xiamenensis]SDK01078.1 hypothetical protein SAMN05216257_101290 [Meinhardsimonia xiamenensis]
MAVKTDPSRRAQSDTGEKGIPLDQLLAAVEAVFGAPPDKITAPGGKRRDSLRVILLGGKSVIATRRRLGSRRARELAFLERMAEAGAPVPRLLGQSGEIFFQSDAGSRRLTAELERSAGPSRESLIAGSFETLWRIKAAARRCGILRESPPIALNAEWLGRFAVAPRLLAKAFRIPSPAIDWNPLAQSLAALPVEFVKWDARPGNAAVGPDGTPIWFDWEHYGRRAGVEDFAFLIADEFWPEDPNTSLRLFRETAPENGRALEPFLVRFATVQVAARLRLIHEDWVRHGWLDADKTRRYDYIGTAPQLVRRLLAHGAALAERDPMTKPAAQWFSEFPPPEDWG